MEGWGLRRGIWNEREMRELGIGPYDWKATGSGEWGVGSGQWALGRVKS